MRWRGDIADFENFFVNKIGDALAAGRDGQTGFVTVERGEFFVFLSEEFQALEARRAGKVFIAFNGDSAVGAADRIGSDEGAAFERFARGAGREI